MNDIRRQLKGYFFGASNANVTRATVEQPMLPGYTLQDLQDDARSPREPIIRREPLPVVDPARMFVTRLNQSRAAYL